VREQVHRAFEEVDAVHLRHPVVGQQDRDPPAAQLDLPQRLQPFLARRRPDDLVLLAVVPSQVPGDGAGDRGIVIHGDHGGAAHALLLLGGWATSGPVSTARMRRRHARRLPY
jgi:hypothetical protein